MKNCLSLGRINISIGFASFALASLVARPLFGYLSDVFGKIKIIVPGMLVASLGIFLLGQISKQNPGYLSIAIFGIGFGAAYAVLSALSVDSVLKFERGKATAILTSSFDLGLASGSSILGFLAMGCGVGSFFMISSLILVAGTLIFWIVDFRTKNFVL